MKMIIAFVQPFMAQKVVHALHMVEGISGATFVAARGFGRGRTGGAPIDKEALLGTGPKVRVEVVVPDHLETLVVRAIREAAHTGRKGDGKVYVVATQRAVRISTGEEGEAAV